MGRKYYVLWIGNTKHGKLARLSSKDGRLDFWVDVDNIEELKRTKRRVAVHTKYPAPEDEGYMNDFFNNRIFVERR